MSPRESYYYANRVRKKERNIRILLFNSQYDYRINEEKLLLTTLRDANRVLSYYIYSRAVGYYLYREKKQTQS